MFARIMHAMTEQMVKSVDTLVREIRIIRKEDPDHIIEIDTGDEIEEIARQVNKMVRSIQELSQRNIALAEVNNRMEMQNLQAQINPHFIYNTLDNIRYLIPTDPQRAQQLIGRFIGILRYSINNTKHNVPVKDDLKYLQDYLVIQSTRFGANFSYEIDIDDACMEFMRKRILAQMINIDKVAYKEVNFKSKLIEWSQKNRVRIDFKSILEEKDKTGSPVFIYRVMLEGVEGCDGKGYSKKESQQLASKLTLEKLRREPQFIDQVFAAKTNRTKMEEEPVENVPSTEQPDDFIIVSSGMEVEAEGSGASNGSNSDSDYRGSISSRNSSDSRRSSDSSDSIDSNDSNNPKAKRNRRSPMYRKDEAAEAATATKTEATKSVEPVSSKLTSADLNLSDEDFDLSHISAKEQTREEIIAAAEAAAFGDT
jgi:hypothetical protein